MPRIQVNMELAKKLNNAFRRFVKREGYTVTGWIRKQILDAAEAQLEKEAKTRETEHAEVE